MDSTLHRWLKLPYPLHVTEFSSPRRPKATYVLLHGIGRSAKAWEELIPLLPKDIRVIGIDLLGFGKSPRPSWAKYNAKTQARSVAVTLFKLRLRQQPILVGHSLGSLVSIEVARKYPLLVKKLILCSPPFYEPTTEKRQLLKRDELLKDLYRQARKYPQTLESLIPLVTKLGLVAKGFEVTSENVGSYIEALESSIVNQTSLSDAAKLKLPVTILYGTLDPVIIASHIKKLADSRDNIIAKGIVTGHDVMGRYTKFIAKEIVDASKKPNKTASV